MPHSATLSQADSSSYVSSHVDTTRGRNTSGNPGGLLQGSMLHSSLLRSALLGAGFGLVFGLVFSQTRIECRRRIDLGIGQRPSVLVSRAGGKHVETRHPRFQRHAGQMLAAASLQLAAYLVCLGAPVGVAPGHSWRNLARPLQAAFQSKPGDRCRRPGGRRQWPDLRPLDVARRIFPTDRRFGRHPIAGRQSARCSSVLPS